MKTRDPYNFPKRGLTALQNGSYTPDLKWGNTFRITATSDITVSNPTNLRDGDFMVLDIITGITDTITFDSMYTQAGTTLGAIMNTSGRMLVYSQYNAAVGEMVLVSAEGLPIVSSAFITEVLTGDDAGVNIRGGQLAVGSPDAGYEAVFGEGDSYPVPIAFHCTIGDTTDLTIINAVDITDILQSDDSSTIGLFGGAAVGDYILVGSLYPYGGVKAKIDTAGTVEPDNVTGEFLMNNTPTWMTAPFMSTNSDFPYTQNGNVLAANSGSEQWRFGFDPDYLPTPWALVTMTINGAEYTYRWARFRITSNITLDPAMEQIKLHTNRVEINADGTTEYYGRSRYAKDLVMHWGLTKELSGFSPANENIVFGNGMTLVYTDNEFINGAIDGRGGYIIVPEGMDTSILVQFVILWQPLSNNAGDVVFSFETVQKSVGDVMDNSETPSSSNQTETIAINEDNVLKRTTFKFLANKLVPGDMVGFGIKRLGADSADTYTDNIALINVRSIGYFWRP